jgi:flagellar assembly protein FliH
MKAWGNKKVFRAGDLPPVQPWQVGEFLGPSVQRPYLRDAEPLPPSLPEEPPLADEGAIGAQDTVAAEAIAEAPVGPTPEEIEAIRQAARIEGYREGFEQGKAEGYEAGHPEGVESGHAEGLLSGAEAAREALQADIERLQNLLQTVQQTVENFEEALADPVARLALVVARKVVGTAFDQRPESIVPLVREALQGMSEIQGPIRLELNPEDAMLCQTHLAAESAVAQWRFEPNPDIHRGGCRISNSTLEIDLTLPTRWRRVVESLGVESEWVGVDE